MHALIELKSKEDWPLRKIKAHTKLVGALWDSSEGFAIFIPWDGFGERGEEGSFASQEKIIFYYWKEEWGIQGIKSFPNIFKWVWFSEFHHYIIKG